MIKNKKINSVVAVVSACSLMAGFTSEAAGSQPEGRVLAVSNENNIVELQRDTFYVMPDTPVVSAKSKIEEEQKIRHSQPFQVQIIYHSSVNTL